MTRDHFKDPVATATDFEAYRRLAPEGTHAAEVTAWLREYQAENEVIP